MMSSHDNPDITIVLSETNLNTIGSNTIFKLMEKIDRMTHLIYKSTDDQ